jgi:hypothetical protein
MIVHAWLERAGSRSRSPSLSPTCVYCALARSRFPRTSPFLLLVLGMGGLDILCFAASFCHGAQGFCLLDGSNQLPQLPHLERFLSLNMYLHPEDQMAYCADQRTELPAVYRNLTVGAWLALFYAIQLHGDLSLGAIIGASLEMKVEWLVLMLFFGPFAKLIKPFLRNHQLGSALIPGSLLTGGARTLWIQGRH